VIDASNPAVQALITAAVTAARTTAEDEKAKILANKEQILAEKKAAAEERDRLKAELEGVRTKTKAGEHGVEPEKYQADVDSAAQAKHKVFEEEHKLVLKDREDKLTAATTEIENLKQANRRAWTEAQLVLATIPESAQVVHPGAWDQLVSAMQSIIEPRTVDGIEGQVARIVVNGTLLPTTGVLPSPDGMMTPAELMLLTRQGKGPLAKLSYLFRSAGQGSGTETVNTTNPNAGRKWSQLDDKQKSEMWRTDAKAAQKMVDDDLLERAQAATGRRAA